MFERVRSRNHDQEQDQQPVPGPGPAPGPGPDADTLQPVSSLPVQADAAGAPGQEQHTGPADRSASAFSACPPLLSKGYNRGSLACLSCHKMPSGFQSAAITLEP